MSKYVLKVKGMHCASCAVLIDKLVGKQPGVVSIKTSYGSEKVAIEYDEAKITLPQIDAFINKLGYDCGARHLLSLRHGTRHADGTHRRHRPRHEVRHNLEGRRSA